MKGVIFTVFQGTVEGKFSLECWWAMINNSAVCSRGLSFLVLTLFTKEGVYCNTPVIESHEPCLHRGIEKSGLNVTAMESDGD